MSIIKKPFFGLRGQRLSWAVTICSGSAFLLFGYDQGIMGSIISTPYFLNAINISVWYPDLANVGDMLTGKLDDAETISTIVSIYDVGCMIGCLVAAVAGTKLGRKQVITIGLSIMVAGAILQSTSYSVAQLIVGRIIAGFGNGMNTGTVPTWVSEISKAGSRGRMVATQLSIAAFGIVIAYWMNYGFFHLHGQVVWRFPVAFQMAFALVSLAILPWMPESPRFLLSKERYEEADQVLSALANAPVDDFDVQADRRAILDAIALEDSKGKFSFRSIVWDRSGQKITQRILLAMAIQMLQEMPGVNMVFYYSSTIFLQLGIVDETALILGGVASIAFWLGSVAAIPLIEKIGRKKLLISGSVPMLIGYCIYTPMIKSRGTTELWVAFGATCVFVAACGWSWLSVPWVYGAELLPVRYRHIGGALNAFTNWTFTFIIVKTGPIGLANIGWRLYLVYIAFTFIAIPAVWFLYPETQGLTLEQIDGVFIKDGTVEFDALNHRKDNLANEKGSMTIETTHVDRTL